MTFAFDLITSYLLFNDCIIVKNECGMTTEN